MAGCTAGHSYEQNLSQIEKMLPDSPRKALRSLDTLIKPLSARDSLHQKLTRLMISAHIEPYSDTTQVWLEQFLSMAKISEDQFHSGIAHFFKGMGFMNSNQEDNALREFISAQANLANTENLYWTALTLKEKSKCLIKLHDGPGAIKAVREAEALFYKLHDTRRGLKCKVNLGDALFIAGRNEEAREAFSKALTEATTAKDSFIMHEALQGLAFTLTYMNKYEEVINTYSKMISLNYHPLENEDWEKLGWAYISTGNLPEAENSFLKLKEEGGQSFGLEGTIYAEKGNFQQAYQCLKQLVIDINEARDKDWSSKRSDIITGHYEAEHALNEQLLEAERKSSWFGWSLVVLLIAVASVAIFQLLKRHKRSVLLNKMVINDFQTILDSLSRQLEDHKSALADTKRQLEEKNLELAEQTKIEKEYRDMNGLLNAKIENMEAGAMEVESMRKANIALMAKSYDLLKEYFAECLKTEQENELKEEWYHKIRNKVKLLQGNQNMLLDMERTLDNYAGNVISTLRKEIPDMQPLDINIIILTIFNFSADTIAYILKINRMKVYNRRNVIKTKLKNKNSLNSIRLRNML